ncbi:PIN domain nuclease [Sphingomonas sp. MA1305]|uniref:type II toxin-antitoxin system VapC family toxin n=1 Tax=Sphingomonas sp. MA1305 TaxID=2479204 RepID=UPI0018E00A14|nr:PIN domain nuclease [Sphingomonas sp. MA1305]MBI0474189.1 PIN domain nuclease [Sphingomonas sp. MA1305]
MVVVDSSVWIDYLRATRTLQTEYLHSCLGGEEVSAGDLIVAEVLQGARDDRRFGIARDLLSLATPLTISDHRVAVEAAQNYRHLRSLGITVRKTIDTLIATRCILDDLPLLYSDRDFDPFVRHLGLRPALALPLE